MFHFQEINRSCVVLPVPAYYTLRQSRCRTVTLASMFVDFSGDPNRIKAQADSVIGRIKEHARYLAKNVSDYNASLTANATSMFDDRRAQLLKQNQVGAALGVPVRKPTDLSKTFAVPATVRKQVAPRPQASSEKYTPEPALDEAIYNDILQTVFDTGRVFERLPSTFSGKDEEC